MPLNILHQLEVCSALLDLLDASRCQFVGELAQNDSVAQDVLVVTRRNGLAQHGVDPFENLLLLFLVTLLRKMSVTDNKDSVEGKLQFKRCDRPAEAKQRKTAHDDSLIIWTKI